MQVVEIDVIRPQALERAFDRAADGLRRAVPVSCPQPNLVARTTSLAASVEHLAEEPLAVSAVSVDLRGVEEGDADLECSLHDRARPLEVDAATEVVAAEADTRCAKAAVA